MTADGDLPELPPLPEPDELGNPMWDALLPTQWAYDQWVESMRSYARLAEQQGRAKERERCAKICDNVMAFHTSHYLLGAKECAAAIRSIKDDSQEEERKT